MNRSAKGSRIERELDLILQKSGFETCRTIRSRFNRNDLWGRYDIMAKYVHYPDFTFYFQSSTNWKYGEARRELETFAMGQYDIIIMSRKRDRQDFEFLVYSGGLWKPMQKDFLLNKFPAWLELRRGTQELPA